MLARKIQYKNATKIHLWINHFYPVPFLSVQFSNAHDSRRLFLVQFLQLNFAEGVCKALEPTNCFGRRPRRKVLSAGLECHHLEPFEWLFPELVGDWITGSVQSTTIPYCRLTPELFPVTHRPPAETQAHFCVPFSCRGSEYVCAPR